MRIANRFDMSLQYLASVTQGLECCCETFRAKTVRQQLRNKMRPDPYSIQPRWKRLAAERASRKASAWWRALIRSRTFWSIIGGLVSFLFVKGIDVLENVRRLPSELIQTKTSLLSWAYRDQDWTGTWSSREEGNVEEVNLASDAIKLDLTANQGSVHGEIFLRTVCNLNPLLIPTLIEGEVLLNGMAR